MIKIKRFDRKGRFRFSFDKIVESQIDNKHKKLEFGSYRDAWNYAIETWGSGYVGYHYIHIQEFDGKKWETVYR